MDTKQVVARFEAERQALALMDHPNIAKVLEAGATDTGRPYFVMELVKGVSITEYCDANTLSTSDRLRLFVEVCHAVQHAHQKGIIHRDIKPTNVMVTLHDGTAVPKVIDFGVAKAMHQRLTEKTLFTAYGQFIGTPAYMSPEQAEMSGLDIDTRSDVYSLGALLYELLTGTTPFDSQSLRRAAYVEIQRMLKEVEPPRPSTCLTTLGAAVGEIAKHRQTDPGALARLIRGDLDWIVMKALEKDRTRRYGSASDLAADIARHFGHEPVMARPPSRSYRLRKFVIKHRGPVAAAAAVGTTIVVLGSLSMWLGWSAQRSAERMRATAVVASAAAAEDPLLKAQLLLEIASRPELPGAVGVAMAAARAPMPLRIFSGHERSLTAAAFSPDGSRIATASRDGTVRVWRADGTGAPVVLRGHIFGVSDVTFSRDSNRVAAASTLGVWIWAANGAGESRLVEGQHLVAVAFSPDGTLVAASTEVGGRPFVETGTDDPRARVVVWHADGSGQPLVLDGQAQQIETLAFSPEGDRIVTASTDGTARIWRVDGTGAPVVFDGHLDEVLSAVFSPDGERVVSSSTDATARVWSADDGTEIAVLREHQWFVSSAAFSPDGTRVVTTSPFDGTTRVWQADGAGAPLVLRGRELSDWAQWPRVGATFSPDGRRVLRVGGGTASVWRVDWTELLDVLRARVRVCLSPSQRTWFLGEAAARAQQAYVACERRFGR